MPLGIFDARGIFSITWLAYAGFYPTRKAVFHGKE